MSGLGILCSGQGRQDAAMFEKMWQYPEAEVLMNRIRESGVLPDQAVTWLDNSAADPDLIFRNDLAQPLVGPALKLYSWKCYSEKLNIGSKGMIRRKGG